MITVSEYNDAHGIAKIRELWRELWWKTPRASFFQSVEWFETSIRRRGGNDRIRVLVVSAAGRPIGIVPLVVKRVSSGLGSLKVLTDSPEERGFFYEPIGPNPAATLEAVLTHVATTAIDWDLFELRHADVQRFERGPAPADLWQSRFGASRRVEERRPIVDCRGDWVHYWASRPEQLRDEYRRCEEELQALGEVEYVRYRPEGSPLDDDNPRWDLFDELERRREDRRRKRRASYGRRLPQAGHDPLPREIHEAATRVAGIDFNVLKLNGRAIAWAYNYRCDGRLETQRVRALPEHKAIASSVLMGRMLRDAFRRGDEYYLFEPAAASAANGWQTGETSRFRYTQFAPQAARAQFLRLVRWIKTRFGSEAPATEAEIRSTPTLAG
jgi:peptidoglycan/xylan/chitin deacetylase (PgdA/CDA1 family)